MKGEPLVLDCSVLVKAIIQETHSGEARALMISGRRLIAPDLMPMELGNVLWKKVQRGTLTRVDALEAYRGLADFAPVRILSSRGYQLRALEIAVVYGRSFYDSLYLAVAEAEGGLFVTADERLVHSLSSSPMGALLHWIGAGLGAIL